MASIRAVVALAVSGCLPYHFPSCYAQNSNMDAKRAAFSAERRAARELERDAAFAAAVPHRRNALEIARELWPEDAWPVADSISRLSLGEQLRSFNGDAAMNAHQMMKHYRAGLEQYKSGNFLLSIQEFQHSLTLAESLIGRQSTLQVDIGFFLAKALDANGDSELARKAWEHQLESVQRVCHSRDPSINHARASLGISLARSARYQEAAEHILRVWADARTQRADEPLDPGVISMHITATRAVGSYLVTIHEFPTALNVYEDVLKLRLFRDLSG